MSDPLDALAPLGPQVRQTVAGFIEAALHRHFEDAHPLFSPDCTFEGSLTAGVLRGAKVIETHYRHVQKGIRERGVTVLKGIGVDGGRVVLDWEVVSPGTQGNQASPGRTFLDLDADGLICRIKTEWNPREAMGR